MTTHQRNKWLTRPNLSSEEISYVHQMDPLNTVSGFALELFISYMTYPMNSTAAVAWVDRLNTIDKPCTRLIKTHLNPYDLDYNPFWDEKADRDDEKHRIRFNTPLDDSCFNIDFFNAASAEGEPLVGSARLPLRDLVLGERAVKKKLVLTCPSGSPIGEVTVMIAVRRVENPLPPEKTVTVVYEEERAVDDFDEEDLT